MGIADKDYFLDENKQLTTDESKAAFRLVNKGQEIPKEMADKYGIGKVAQSDDISKESEGAETVKKAPKPSANKSEKPSENKAAGRSNEK